MSLRTNLATTVTALLLAGGMTIARASPSTRSAVAQDAGLSSLPQTNQVRESEPHVTAGPSPATGATKPRYEILSLATAGTLYGSCPSAGKTWTLRFVNSTSADDLAHLQVGHAAALKAVLHPGYEILWHLAADAVRTHEPPDHSPREPAGTVSTTSPSEITISQSTEPHTFQTQVLRRLAAAGDGTTRCVPIISRIRASTYFNTR